MELEAGVMKYEVISEAEARDLLGNAFDAKKLRRIDKGGAIYYTMESVQEQSTGIQAPD
jgi:hypothetical protein